MRERTSMNTMSKQNTNSNEDIRLLNRFKRLAECESMTQCMAIRLLGLFTFLVFVSGRSWRNARIIEFYNGGIPLQGKIKNYVKWFGGSTHVQLLEYKYRMCEALLCFFWKQYFIEKDVIPEFNESNHIIDFLEFLSSEILVYDNSDFVKSCFGCDTTKKVMDACWVEGTLFICQSKHKKNILQYKLQIVRMNEIITKYRKTHQKSPNIFRRSLNVLRKRLRIIEQLGR